MSDPSLNSTTPPAPPPRRHNGLSRPYSNSQIIAFSCLIFSCLEWLLVIAPILPKCAASPVTLVWFGAVALVCHFGVQTLLVDPIDVHLCRHWKEHQQDAVSLMQQQQPHNACNKWNISLYQAANAERQARPVPPDEPMKHCWICDVAVAEHSMHCKFCNKCVYHFDHHCIWLNTVRGVCS